MNGIRNTLFILLFTSAAFAYQWPLKPFDQQHNVSATFCENRPSGDILIHHFHNAIDIPLAEGGEVFAIEAGYVEGVVRTGYASYIRVGRYNYLHVTPLSTLDLNDYVQKGQLVGHTNYPNHIHLIDGYYPDYINPLRKGGIAPFEDGYLPTVAYVKFYMDGTTTEFKNGKVTGLVDIVARLYDKTDNGSLGSNNGIYLAGYQIYDSTGTTALTDPYIPYQFDVRPANEYVTNVYFPGSDLSTYIYILTNRVEKNNYWDTRRFAPGKYKIKVFTEDTRDNRKEFWTTVQVDKQDVTPPAIPVVKQFKGSRNGDWRLSWFKNDSSDVAGYEFWYSVKGDVFKKHSSISAALSAQDTGYTYANYGTSFPLYVRLRAYDDAPIPNYSEFSSTTVMKNNSTAPTVLLVDGFRRSDGYWQEPRHDLVIDYARMLLENDLAFDGCTLKSIAAGQVSLTEYRTAILFLGDDTMFNTAVRQDVADFLEQGGNLFLSGSEMAAGLIRAGQADFLADYLHITLVDDSATVTTVASDRAEAPLIAPEGRMPATDILSPVNGGFTFWTYDAGQTAGVAYKGLFANGGYPGRLVVAGFPFETLADDQARQDLFDEVLRFFDLPVSITDSGGETIPQTQRLLTSYPNPFNSTTRIEFVLPGNKGALKKVQLDVYDAAGRHVKRLMQKKLTPGTYHIVWDGKNESGRMAGSGIYFCIYRHGQKTSATRLVMIR